ncbi:hypothetical protein BC826DRAFT_969205 [Russula brevipes]|nr:hypothetical protein BC826DRAFT_969205 [Russula brevipes]
MSEEFFGSPGDVGGCASQAELMECALRFCARHTTLRGGTAWAHAGTSSSIDDEISEISLKPACEQRLSLRWLQVPGGVGDDSGESEPEREDADDRPESASEKSELSWLAACEDSAGISCDYRSASESSVGGRTGVLPGVSTHS